MNCSDRGTCTYSDENHPPADKRFRFFSSQIFNCLLAEKLTDAGGELPVFVYL